MLAESLQPKVGTQTAPDGQSPQNTRQKQVFTHTVRPWDPLGLRGLVGEQWLALQRPPLQQPHPSSLLPIPQPRSGPAGEVSCTVLAPESAF